MINSSKINNGAKFKVSELNVKYDGIGGKLYISHMKDYENGEFGVETVFNGAKIFSYKISDDKKQTRQYFDLTSEIGINLPFNETVEFLMGEKFDKNQELSVFEILELETTLNQYLANTFNRIVVADTKGVGEYNFVEKGEIFAVRDGFDERTQQLYTSYIRSAQKEHAILYDIEKDKYYHLEDYNVSELSKKPENLKNVSVKDYFEVESENSMGVNFFTLDALKQKIAEKNGSTFQ